MTEHLVTLEQIREARPLLAGRVHRTPLFSSTTAGRIIAAASGVAIADGRLHLKAEHLQKTGSFKPRGGLVRLAALTPAERRRGVITISAGNAGQSYAWASHEAGVHCVVVMPEGAVRSKVEACAAYGAEVVLHGADVGETFERMQALRDERDLTFVHPFDDPNVIAGNGSIGLELLEDLPDLDVVVVGVGGGGLIAGIAAAVKELRPSVRVYGVEPEGSDALFLALAAGEVVRVQPGSVADGLGSPFAGALPLAMAQRYVDEVILLNDPTILGGLRFAIERLKQVVEPAGAAPLAAVLSGRVPLRDGDRVAVVLSGGNVDVTRLGSLIEAAGPLTPHQ